MPLFTRLLGRSIYSPELYATIPQRRFWSALAYFVQLLLVVAFVRLVASAAPLLAIGPALGAIASEIAAQYPSESKILIRNGQVATNVVEPLFVLTPPTLAQRQADTRSNLLVIDTKTPFSVSQFRDYQTYAWLTKDALFVGDEDDVRAFDLSRVDSVEIDKSLVNTVHGYAAGWMRIVGPVLIFLAFVVFALLYAFRMVYLLILALAVMLLSRVLEWRLDYGQSYKVGLHAMTLPLLIELALSISERWLPFRGFPFMFTLVMLVVVFFNARGVSRAAAR